MFVHRRPLMWSGRMMRVLINCALSQTDVADVTDPPPVKQQTETCTQSAALQFLAAVCHHR